MTTSLTTVRPDEYQIIRDQAQSLVKTGFLPQAIKTPEQALAIILTGRELGIPAMAALNTINVIQGKPTVSPQLMLALIERSGQLEDIKVDVTDKGASVTMKRKGRTPHTETFGQTEAQAMGLLGKDNYKKQAGVMYKWRAVAACARTVFPDVILGLYTPEEMGAEVSVSDDGVMTVEAPVEQLPPPPAEIVVDKEMLRQESPERTEAIAKCGQLMRDLNKGGFVPPFTKTTVNNLLQEHFRADSIDDLLDDELTELVVFLEDQLSSLEETEEVAF
jgi:hypothetical protein